MSRPWASGSGGLVLKWMAALIEDLVDEQPGNHTRIVAIGSALVAHANPDGTRCRPGIRRLAHETGQHYGRAQEAMTWLIDHGWLAFVRRVAHGGREFTLTIPQRSGEGNAASDPERATPAVSDPVSGPVSDPERATNLLPSHLKSSSDPLPITDAEVEEIALEKARANGARSPARYAAKIVLEDRRELESEARRRKEAALGAGAVAECDRCDANGRSWFTNDGDPVAHDDPHATTADICKHRSDLAEIDELSESYS